jgi:hypothetical protein
MTVRPTASIGHADPPAVDDRPAPTPDVRIPAACLLGRVLGEYRDATERADAARHRALAAAVAGDVAGRWHAARDADEAAADWEQIRGDIATVVWLGLKHWAEINHFTADKVFAELPVVRDLIRLAADHDAELADLRHRVADLEAVAAAPAGAGGGW